MANGKSPFKILGPEIFGILAVFVIILGVLNYYNALSLSQLYPKLFGFLPHQTVSYPTSQNPFSNPLPITVYCPVPIRPCQGKDMFKNKSYAGIGFKLKTGDPIFAAIQGDIIYKDRNSTRSSILDDAVILGKGDAKGYMAVYNFVGDKLGSELMKGISGSGVIAIASSGSLIDFQDSKHINLIFRLQRIKGNVIHLDSSNFQ